MRNLVDNLLKLVQQGDLSHLRQWIGEKFPEKDHDIQNPHWTSLYHSKSGDTAQIVAARCGHLDILKWLREEVGIVFSQSNFGGKHPLHEAAQHSRLECVKYLLAEGSDTDCIKQADWTPLMLACTKKDLEVVKELVRSGANLNLRNKDGWTCFHIATREGYEEIINYLLDQDRSLWNTVSKNGRTPLHTTAHNGQLIATQILLKRGQYAVDMADSCGSTPLMDAVLNGHLEIADLLTESQGSSLSIENNVGRQAIHLAAQVGNISAIKYLVCKKGLDVNTPSTSSGVTPLHMAAKEKQAEMIQHLIKLDADVQSVDLKGRTPLHIAAGVQDGECIRTLLACGAKNCTDSSGKSARDLVMTDALRNLFNGFEKL